MLGIINQLARPDIYVLTHRPQNKKPEGVAAVSGIPTVNAS